VIGTDGRIKLSNPRYHALWKLPEKTMNGEPHIRDILPYALGAFDLNDAEWDKIVERIVAQSTEPMSRSGRIERADGRVLDWAQVPLPDSASLFTYVDVTDSIRVERALRERNEALETADRLKSEFIANISYELRTPLNSINGFAEMLDAEYFGKLNARQHDYAKAIVQSAQSLAELINDILDLASIEAGYMEIQLSTISAGELLESLRSLAAERTHRRRLQLSVDCPDDVGAFVADERRLKQALFSLISNAMKFTPETGGITIGVRGDDDEIRFFVSDTGPGIELERQGSVFQPFEHGGDGPRRSGAGAGLGLALVKRLIELHDGSVELLSAPGEGTTVICRLPRRAEDVTQGPATRDGEALRQV
jgi:signal transduction histidine kinase